MNNSRFRRGSGCFECEVCGRKTRDTHRAGVPYCSQCLELTEMVNALEDGIAEIGEFADRIRKLTGEIIAKGGKIEGTDGEALLAEVEADEEEVEEGERWAADRDLVWS